MKVVELLHELTEMPLMAEVVFCDDAQMITATVDAVEELRVGDLPPVCYIGPRTRLELVR